MQQLLLQTTMYFITSANLSSIPEAAQKRNVPGSTVNVQQMERLRGTAAAENGIPEVLCSYAGKPLWHVKTQVWNLEFVFFDRLKLRLFCPKPP